MSVLLVTALRLSPAERGVGVGKTVTLTVLPANCLPNGTKQTKVPVAFQRPLALARFHVPDPDGLVSGCRHDRLAVGRKIARQDPTTAIFLKCQGTHL